MNDVIKAAVDGAPWLAGFILLALVQWRFTRDLLTRLDDCEQRYDNLALYVVQHTDLKPQDVRAASASTLPGH